MITNLKIVRMENPSLCEEIKCRFNHIALVTMANGEQRRMQHCKRLDCDNWIEEQGPQPVHIESE